MTRSHFIRLLAALCACATLPVHAAISVADITAQLRRQPEPAGTFTQTRYLRGMNRPLIASGRFALQQGALYWKNPSPAACASPPTASASGRAKTGSQRAPQRQTKRKPASSSPSFAPTKPP